MNKLEERFYDIFTDEVGRLESEERRSCSDVVAKEAKEIAIEFVKKVLNSKITIQRHGHVGVDLDIDQYWPKEFQLMLGQLLKDGDDIFNEFIEERYASK